MWAPFSHLLFWRVGDATRVGHMGPCSVEGAGLRGTELDHEGHLWDHGPFGGSAGPQTNLLHGEGDACPNVVGIPAFINQFFESHFMLKRDAK